MHWPRTRGERRIRRLSVIALAISWIVSASVLAQVSVELGPEETVLSWSDGTRCGVTDIPDLPARAFVDADGRVQLLAGHLVLYRSIGDNLTAVTRDCSGPVSVSHQDPVPRHYDDFEWIASTYTLDGRTVLALVHDEYEGWQHGNCNTSPIFNCWWNAITLVRSTDTGVSYPHAAPLLPPAHVVASSPYDYDPNNTTGPFGYFDPSNILEWGGAYHALFHVETKGTQQWGTCLARTTQLDVPGSWRGWDGSAYSIPLDRGVCPPMRRDAIGKMHESLTYNTYLGAFLLVGCDGSEHDFDFAVSDTLTGWTSHSLLMPTDLWWTTGATRMRGYPTLLQPGDPTRNFERTGRSPYLYYTDWDQIAGVYARDLKRRRVRFTRAGDEGRYPVLELAMNEHRGTTTLDSAFYGNDGTLEGGAAFVTSARATGPAAIRFDGAGARVRVAAAPSLELEGSLTIDAFVLFDEPIGAGDRPTIVEKHSIDGRHGYALRVGAPDGALTFRHARPDGGTSSFAGTWRIDDGRWHHVAVAFSADDASAHLSVDGLVDETHALDGGDEPGATANDLVVGGGFVGFIDGVRIRNHAVDAAVLVEESRGSGNVELCNAIDDDGDGAPDEDFACARGTEETRTCEGETQVRRCDRTCSWTAWPACASIDAGAPDGGAGPSPTPPGCGCGEAGGLTLIGWVALALATALNRPLLRRASARART